MQLSNVICDCACACACNYDNDGGKMQQKLKNIAISSNPEDDSLTN